MSNFTNRSFSPPSPLLGFHAEIWRIKMMMRHHTRYHDRVTTIVNFVCLRSRRLRWRRKGSGEGGGRGGSWQGHCAKWPRRRVWQSAHQAFVLSLMNSLLTAQLLVRRALDRRRHCPVVRGALTRYEKSRGERKGTPGHETRIMDEMRTKRMPRSRCKHDDDEDDALAATSNREKMLLRSQRYCALFWRTSVRACQLRPISANHVSPRCKCIYIGRADAMYVYTYFVARLVLRNESCSRLLNIATLAGARARNRILPPFFWKE